MNLIAQLLFSISLFSSGQNQESQLKTQLGARLNVETKIVGQKSCLLDSSNNEPLVRIDLGLLITFTNIGNYPIILDKSSGTISGEMLSHSQNEAIAEKYELETIKDILVAGGTQEREGAYPSNQFILLKPGKSFKKNSETRLIITSYEHYSATEHFARFAIWTESGILSEANDINKLRQRWLKYGYLWTEGAISQPMKIDFDKVENLKKCKG